VAALVISPEQEEGRGIPHLDGVEVENHLRKRIARKRVNKEKASSRSYRKRTSMEK